MNPGILSVMSDFSTVPLAKNRGERILFLSLSNQEPDFRGGTLFRITRFLLQVGLHRPFGLILVARGMCRSMGRGRRAS
jgi:hypothetical protein